MSMSLSIPPTPAPSPPQPAGHPELVEFLCSKKAEVTAVNKNKDTPLHLASFKGHVNAARILLKYGADRKSLNTDGKSPVDLALTSDMKAILPRMDQQEIANAIVMASSDESSDEDDQ
jgi:ankyrin repeat protein